MLSRRPRRGVPSRPVEGARPAQRHPDDAMTRLRAMSDTAWRLRGRLASLWPKASLRVYLAAIMLIATLPVIAFMAYKIVLDVGAERARIWRDLERSAAATAQSVERELAATVDALTIIGQTTLAANDDSAEFQALVRDEPRLRPEWRGAFLIAANGDVLVDVTFGVPNAPRAPPANVADQLDLRAMQLQPRPTISNLI